MEMKVKEGSFHQNDYNHGSMKKKKGSSAKAHLHELCSINHWNQPLFYCCKEEGPDHNKRFTFKVVFEIKEATRYREVECYGNSESGKKAAAESAAEGALWYLNQAGYLPSKISC